MNNANKVAVTVKEQGKETQDMIIPPDVSVESVFRDCSVTMLRGDTTRKELNPKQIGRAHV